MQRSLMYCYECGATSCRYRGAGGTPEEPSSMGRTFALLKLTIVTHRAYVGLPVHFR